MPDAHDPWKPSTGLIEEYTGRVNDAWFEVDLDYSADAVLLKLEIVGEDVPDGARVESYSIGKSQDWEIAKNGKQVVPVGKSKSFNENSKGGRLMAAALVADPNLRDKGLPTEAGTWVGLSAHWVLDRKEFPNLPKDDGTPTVSSAMLPKSGDSGKAEPANKPAATVESNGHISSGVKETLLTLAKNSKNHDEFIDSAFAKVDEVASDSDVEKYVLDKRGGAWRDAFAGTAL